MEDEKINNWNAHDMGGFCLAVNVGGFLGAIFLFGIYRAGEMSATHLILSFFIAWIMQIAIIFHEFRRLPKVKNRGKK